MTIATAKAYFGEYNMSTQPASTAGEQSSDSLTESQLVEQLLGSQLPQETEPEDIIQEGEPEGEPEDPPEGEELEGGEEGEPEGEPTDDDLIEQLLSKDPERLKEIARLAGVKSVSRYAEMTAKNKALAEQLQARTAETKPLPEALPDNPFRGMDAKQVEDKRKDLGKVADTIESILDDHENYGPEDVIEYGGKEFTKKELKSIRRGITKQLTDFIPDQLAEIQRIEQREYVRSQYEAAIPVQIPEISDEESEVAILYKSLMADPLSKQIAEKIPDMAQLPFIMAHAANSIIQARNKQPVKAATAPGAKARPRVAASPVGAVATPTRTEANVKVKEKEDKFMSSGRAGDLEAFLIAKSR